MLEWLSFSVSDIWIRELRPVVSTVYQESVEMIHVEMMFAIIVGCVLHSHEESPQHFCLLGLPIRSLNMEKQLESHPGQIWETSPSRVTAWGLVQGL